MTTRRMPSKSMATSSALADLTRPPYTSSALAASDTTAEPKTTSVIDWFIALHMIWVRISPDARQVVNVVTLLLAGHETTANALAWTCYLVSQSPDVEQRLCGGTAGLAREKRKHSAAQVGADG